MAEHFAEKLPKNIRQIGTPNEKQKFYIEDYVHTYLHSFIKEKYKEDTLRAAVLLGDYWQEEDCTVSFVKGAVACDFSQLHQDMSEELSRSVREFFPEWEMLGWYVCAKGVDGHIQSEIKHYYAREERRQPGYLIYEDELEKETDVFVWKQNALHKLTGYYIYYERNPRMQEFLIKEKGGRPQEAPIYTAEKAEAQSIKEEKLPIYKEASDSNKRVRSFAAKKEHVAKSRHPHRLVYAACAVVLIVLAAMGVSQIGNYNNLQQLQEAISNTIVPTDQPLEMNDPVVDNEESAKDNEQAKAESKAEEESLAAESEAEANPGTEGSETEDGAVVEETAEGTATELEQEVSLDKTETAAEETYVVQKGDSLFSISRKLYENEDMVERISQLNGITNYNLIYEGQKLKLP